VVGAWKSPKPRRGGVVVRDGGGIPGRGRDKRAHHDKYIGRAEVREWRFAPQRKHDIGCLYTLFDEFSYIRFFKTS